MANPPPKAGRAIPINSGMSRKARYLFTRGVDIGGEAKDIVATFPYNQESVALSMAKAKRRARRSKGNLASGGPP